MLDGVGRKYILELLEIDVLPRGQNFEVPSIVFANIVNTIAKIRNATSEEIEALNQKNVVKLIGKDPKLKEITKLMEKFP